MAQLPSTATIKDIIAALQTMECINQKADLASVVGSPALSTDDIATIITKLQNAKNTLAANINTQGINTAIGTESLAALATKVSSSPVKRWATGIIPGRGNESAGTISYSSVTGLAFNPSVLIFRNSLPSERFTVITRNFGTAFDVPGSSFTSGTWSGTYTQFNAWLTNGFQLKNKITDSTSDSIQNINWIAFE